MPALDLIRPSVTAMRVIASVNADFAQISRGCNFTHFSFSFIVIHNI